MSSTPSPLQSTRLENLSFESDGARLEFDGQSVRIKKELDPASVTALRGFYLAALAEYHARPETPPRPGWFSRLRSWIGRLFSPSAASPAQSAAPSDPAGVRSTPVTETAWPPSATGRSRTAEKPAPSHAKAAEATRSATPETPTIGLPAAPDPTLRAVFADQAGVHLIWQAPARGGPPAQVELHHRLDSDLAKRLQDCYGHLDRLGYKVVGLELLRANPRDPAQTPAEADPEKSPVHPVTAPGVRAAGPAVKPATPSPEPAEKKDRPLLVRLDPEVLEQPDRALVIPADNPENKQILVAPERLLKALRAAADPSHPPAERVTRLRCAPGKSGLKLLEVGVGEGKNNEPSRWEPPAKWLPKEAEAPPTPKPRPPSEPELNL
jgi:hypothetical protein